MNDTNLENKVIQIKLDDIIPNRFQPREVFDENGLEELADSIKEHGVIQPIIVRKIGDKYELIAGERRTKASALAGKTTIPAIIREMDDKESAKVSLLENLQRKNLSAIEEAKTYKKIIELENMTQEELARTMGRSQPMIANKLRLLSLPQEIQDALMKNQISERHARSLLTIQDKKDQLDFLDKIINERLTVRELDSEIKKYKEKKVEKSNEDIEEEKESFMNNRSNFGGMGLNDYQSGVNNMFNNIPNNFNNNTMDTGIQDNNTNNEFVGGINTPNSFNNQNILSNDNMGNQVSSLGSMFDGIPSNEMMTNMSDNSNDSNLFISQIKNNNVPSKENQFLPNFDDNGAPTSFDNNFGMNNNFSNQNANNYSINNDFSTNNMGMYQTNPNNMYGNNVNQTNNFNQPMDMMPNNQFNQINEQPYNQNNNYNMPNENNFNQQIYNNEMNNMSSQSQLGNFDFYGNPVSNPNEAYHANYNNPTINNNMPMNGMDQYNPFNVQRGNTVPDYGNPNNNFNVQPNNGGLFNQPLNIVGPYGDENIINEQNDNQDNSPVSSQVNNEVTPSDNILNNDKPIENSILNNENSAPLPNIPDIEVIGGDIPTPETSSQEEQKNDYIRLEEEITIHSIHDAVMELKKTTDKIKQNKINIETEEIEFDDVYQITIKLKKEDI